MHRSWYDYVEWATILFYSGGSVVSLLVMYFTLSLGVSLTNLFGTRLLTSREGGTFHQTPFDVGFSGGPPCHLLRPQGLDQVSCPGQQLQGREKEYTSVAGEPPPLAILCGDVAHRTLQDGLPGSIHTGLSQGHSRNQILVRSVPFCFRVLVIASRKDRIKHMMRHKMSHILRAKSYSDLARVQYR